MSSFLRIKCKNMIFDLGRNRGFLQGERRRWGREEAADEER
jgi:hypothetical protein